MRERPLPDPYSHYPVALPPSGQMPRRLLSLPKNRKMLYFQITTKIQRTIHSGLSKEILEIIKVEKTQNAKNK